MPIESRVQLRRMNTLRLGSVAEYFIRVTNEDQLSEALHWAREQGLLVTPLGEGSNVVLQEFIPGLVIHVALNGIELLADDGQHIRLRVAAGENWHALVSWSSKQGFHGLENLALIPGSVGSAPVQNIGAYGSEIAHFIDSVRAYQCSTGQCITISAENCRFGYRNSIFKRAEGKEMVIVSVDFKLDRYAHPVADYPSLIEELKGAPVTPRSVFDAVVAIRQRRLPNPAVAPNVGSFFKNPSVSWHDAEVMSMRWPELPQYSAGTDTGAVKLSAAWMIDRLGWRGKLVDGVKISAQHSLILVNESAQASGPVLALADQIMESVEREFGIALHIEPDVLGQSPDADV